MSISTRLIYAAFRGAHKSFVKDTKEPEAAVDRLWKIIWKEVGESKHWREHRPSAQPDLTDFPLTAYKDYQETIAESYRSGESLMARSKIVCWG